jgi:hypothetical protein
MISSYFKLTFRDLTIYSGVESAADSIRLASRSSAGKAGAATPLRREKQQAKRLRGGSASTALIFKSHSSSFSILLKVSTTRGLSEKNLISLGS